MMIIKKMFFPVLVCLLASQVDATNQEDDQQASATLKDRYEKLQLQRITQARNMQAQLLSMMQGNNTPASHTQPSPQRKTSPKK